MFWRKRPPQADFFDKLNAALKTNAAFFVCIISHVSSKDRNDAYTNPYTRNERNGGMSVLEAKAVGDEVTVVIAGELDHYAAPQIRRQLDRILEDPMVIHLVLDLENLTFMDSSGIGVLLGRLRVLQSRGGAMSVRNMRPSVEKLFRLSGLHRVIGMENGGGRY